MKTIKDLVDFDNPESSYYYEKIRKMEFIVSYAATQISACNKCIRNPLSDEGMRMHYLFEYYSIDYNLQVVFDIVLDTSKYTGKMDPGFKTCPGISIEHCYDRFGREGIDELEGVKNQFAKKYFKNIKKLLF